MASEGGLATSARTKVSTGYGRLDEALQGGFLAGSAIVLSAPASDEVPLLLRNFLESAKDGSLLICKTLSSAENLAKSENVKALVCSDKPSPPAKNIIPGKGIENLTELNIVIGDSINSLQPKRLLIDILSDILLRHKALQTRKWLTDLLERLRSKGITTLAVLNPYMHAAEEAQAVTDIFDGNLEIIEKQAEDGLKKFIRIKWMHGIETAENEFFLTGLSLEQPGQAPQVTARAAPAPVKEARWVTPLVSRTGELGKLKTAFDDALGGKTSVVALQGEVGIGKTRLTHELGSYAKSKGALVLSGAATEDGLPYAPWVEFVRQYVGEVPGELLRRMLGSNASELVKLVPDITAKLGTISASKPLGEQQDKVRFYEAITQFFISLCNDTPLLLLFDDMRYADQSSLDLLEYFARSTNGLRVLTVCSCPSEQEIGTDTLLEQTLMKFNKQRLLETVTLKGLSKDETTTLIRQTFGEQTITPEFADLVYQHTGGNPFFVEEVLRSLVEDGTIFRTGKGWDRKPIQDIGIPKSVKSALKARLSKLNPDTVNAVTMAAVIGSEFDFQVLQEVTQLGPETLLPKIEEALSAGLLLEDTRQMGILRFSDNRIRELLLDDLSKLRKASYHLKIGEAMEKAHAENLQTHAGAIANHFFEAGDKKRAIKYSITAGDRNKAIHAYDQAISDYKRAIDLIVTEAGSEEEKASTLEKLADNYQLAGRLEDANRCSRESLGIFEKLRDMKACARICLGLSKIVFLAQETPGVRDAILVLEQGLKYLENEPECFEAASIYGRLTWFHGVIDEWDKASSWAEKALSVGEKTQNYAAIAGSLQMKGSMLTDTGRIDEGLPLWEQSYEVALKHEKFEEAGYSLMNLSTYTFPRDLTKAREFALRGLELAKSLNHKVHEASLMEWLSFVDWYRGDWVAVQEELQGALEIAERLELTAREENYHFDKGWLLLATGDLQQAETEFQRGSKVMKEDPKISGQVYYRLALGKLREAEGREDEAREHFEAAVESFRKWEFTTYPHLHIETLLHLTEIYARHGEIEKANEDSRWAKRIAETLRGDACLAMASEAEAIVLVAKGDRKGAEEAYLKSLTLWEKAGWPYYHAKALVGYSEAVAQTNPEESKRRLQQAAETFRKLGAKLDLEKAQAKLSAK